MVIGSRLVIIMLCSGKEHILLPIGYVGILGHEAIYIQVAILFVN